MKNTTEQNIQKILEIMAGTYHTDEVFTSLKNAATGLEYNSETCRRMNVDRSRKVRFMTNSFIKNVATIELNIQFLFEYYFPHEKGQLEYEKNRILETIAKKYHEEE